jgi:hypothetical protein
MSVVTLDVTVPFITLVGHNGIEVVTAVKFYIRKYYERFEFNRAEFLEIFKGNYQYSV